jgi:hypothetical protein
MGNFFMRIKFGVNENYCYVGFCIIFGKCIGRYFRDLRICQKSCCDGLYFPQDMMNIFSTFSLYPSFLFVFSVLCMVQ